MGAFNEFLGGGSGCLLLGSLVVSLLVSLHVRSPEGEVIAEELHDEGRVPGCLVFDGNVGVNSLVRLLGKGVELGDSVIKGLLGEVASAVGRVEDLVVEDGKVQGETETDGVRRGEFRHGNVGSGLVGLERLVGRVLALVTGGELGEVTVVVSHPGGQQVGVRRAGGGTWKGQSARLLYLPTPLDQLTSCGRRPCSHR